MNIETKIKTFEERKAGGYIVSCSPMDVVRDETKGTLSIVGCNFHGINQDDSTAMFSLTELDDKTGFVVVMRDVTVIPSNYIFLKSAPKWLTVLIHKFGKV
jgi:hypothetical protein